MNKKILSKELKRIADILSYNVDEMEKFTADIARELLKLKNKAGINYIRQYYKGTGNRSPRRSLSIKLLDGKLYDVRLGMDSFVFNDLQTHKYGIGVQEYGNDTPEIIAKKILDNIIALSKTITSAKIEDVDFLKAVGEFKDYCQGVIDGHYKKNFNNLKIPKLDITEGGRYIKFVRLNAETNRPESVWCFVDKSNGDILKPASYNAPAKHARGSIYDKNSWKSIGPYGPAYLR